MVRGALERIIVVPRNGYLNRLQAWASCAALGQRLNAPVQVCWEPEPVSPARATDLFRATEAGSSFIPPSDVTAILGTRHREVERYLTYLEDRATVVLAGHDRGEQTFMSPLAALLDGPTRVANLVIIAGGAFHHEDAIDPEADRRAFYSGLPWTSQIEGMTAEALEGRPAFAALHVRQTDRSREAPTSAAIDRALRRLRSITGASDLFVAADTPEGRDRWLQRAGSAGFHVWSAPRGHAAREDAAGAVSAIVDWRLLAHSRGLVYTAESSFGHEAAVAGNIGTTSLPLRASRSRQVARDVNRHLTAGLSYPKRHGWFGR